MNETAESAAQASPPPRLSLPRCISVSSSEASTPTQDSSPQLPADEGDGGDGGDGGGQRIQMGLRGKLTHANLAKLNSRASGVPKDLGL